MQTKKTKSENLFTIGKTSVEINPQKNNPYIPEKEIYVLGKEDNDMAEKLLKGIQKNMPVLIIGPTGCGKTATVKFIANKTNNGYRRLQLNGSTGVENMVGRWLINKEGTFWVDGILTDAMRKGHYLLLDELNMALPEILAILNSVMDDDHKLILDEKDGEVVKAHPNFRIFAAINPWEDYAGTKEMNRALIDRFPIVMNVDYPTPKKELEILIAHTGLKDEASKKSEKSIPTRMIELANILRVKNKSAQMLFSCSTRQLIYWGKLIEDFGVKKAAEITLMNKAEAEDVKKIKDELDKIFRNDE